MIICSETLSSYDMGTMGLVLLNLSTHLDTS